MEQLPRRTSCRLLAKKLYEEEDGVSFASQIFIAFSPVDSVIHRFIMTLNEK